jgi:Diguanylate cyclase, GGDEF domain
VVYLFRYPAFAIGLLLLARAVGRRDTGALLDALVVAIGSGVIAWVALVTPYATDETLSLASGHVIDAGWLLGFGLAGAAALHPSAGSVMPAERAAPLPLLPRSRLLLLAVASLVAPGLVVSAGTREAKFDLVVVGIASGVLFLLVLWRMAGLVRQISLQPAELDELSLTDALTGWPTAGGGTRSFRRQSLGHSDRARPSPSGCSTSTSSKAFNDTFGHPAGDALLKATAEAWQTELRPGDLLATDRWRGVRGAAHRLRRRCGAHGSRATPRGDPAGGDVFRRSRGTRTVRYVHRRGGARRRSALPRQGHRTELCCRGSNVAAGTQQQIGAQPLTFRSGARFAAFPQRSCPDAGARAGSVVGNANPRSAVGVAEP